MNTFQVFSYGNARVESSLFATAAGVQEAHLMIHATQPDDSFQQQLQAVRAACAKVLRQWGAVLTPVMKRYWLSDAANQEACVRRSEPDGCALSTVQQPPLDGTKVALWVYGLANVTVETLAEGLVAARQGTFTHLWLAQAIATGDDSGTQTRHILQRYADQLGHSGCTLADHCVRTWFFVDDIDHQYADFVDGRNAVFDAQRLTPDTHFIASTGIGGRTANATARVMMDAYAVQGLQPGQVAHLYAPDHLNRTSDYGVRFERGTTVDYADRRQAFISGTASIDNQGRVVAPGNIRLQTQRMWQNVQALLAEADMDFGHVAQLLVYLRDPSDYAVVSRLFARRFPATPHVILWAPVCRPGWLIEMECIAVKATDTDA